MEKLSDFVNGDRFELNSYLNYLLDKFKKEAKDYSEDTLVKQYFH